VSFTRPTLITFLVLALAGCGGGDDEPQQPAGAEAPATATAPTTTAAEPSAAGAGDVEAARRPEGTAGLRMPARRARIIAKDSPYGRVLYDANGQVVYVFEIDGRDESNCTSSDCVKAWPPVLTEEEPTAGAGVDEGLLGTILREDGKLQVTYAGRPLYFYEHEGPGEVRCHNVNLHGGLWWVVTPAGEPAA
jgi:predicted lipoprotein with Yx(FWY)xxD motif